MVGDLDGAGLVEQRVFGEHAVDHAAERIMSGIGGNAAAGPTHKEGAGDAVADLELADAGSDLDHFAGAVGERDHRKFGVAVDALDHALVAVIQRGRAHAHDDLAVTRLRLRPFAVQDQAVEAGRCAHLVGPHAVSVWLSIMPATFLSAARRLSNSAMPSASALRLTA